MLNVIRVSRRRLVKGDPVIKMKITSELLHGQLNSLRWIAAVFQCVIIVLIDRRVGRGK
jgi:hypothetical protein